MVVFRINLVGVFLLAACSLAFVSSAQVTVMAANYYVSTTGNNANPGTQAAPWRTIQHAASTMVAGDTTTVNAGTYNEKVSTVRNGAATGRITFKASGTVVTHTFLNVDHDYITIDGFEMTNAQEGFMMKIGGSNVEIINNNIHDTGSRFAVIQMTNDNATGNLIKNNRYRSSTGPGDDLIVMSVGGSNQIVEGNDIGPAKDIDAFRVFGSNNIIRNNYIHDVTESAGTGAHMDVIQIFGGYPGAMSRDIVFEKNRIVNFQGQMLMTEHNGSSATIRDWDIRNNVYQNVALQANFGIPNIRFVNNTLYDVGSANNLVLNGQADNLQVKNNLIITASNVTNYGNVMAIGGPDISISNNYVASINGFAPLIPLPDFTEPNGINGGDAQFANATANDFHLLSTSPAINMGATLIGFDYDHDGVTRPQGTAWDIGAFEFGGTPLLPGDYDGNGAINFLDYDTWRVAFGQSVTPGSGADGNSNGIVDAADYVVWRDNLGSGSAAASPVPEPSALTSAITLCMVYYWPRAIFSRDAYHRPTNRNDLK